MKSHSYRSTWADVNLSHISNNVRHFKNYLKTDTLLMAVVKADGYGHGAIEVAKSALQGGANYLAVALLEEALDLREAGFKESILLLSPIEKEGIPIALKNNISLTVFTEKTAKEIITYKNELQIASPIRIHIKIETGMNRIGIKKIEETLRVFNLFKAEDIQVEGIYTHFAEAENRADPSFTQEQYDSFMQVVETLENHGFQIPIKHCCNTAATLAYPEFQLDMVRVGIGLYGLYPSIELADLMPLQPAMHLKSKVMLVKDIKAGESVGYGRTYVADSARKIATIPIGYADGYQRQLSNKGFASLQKNTVPIAGLVCMDQSMLDVTDIPTVNIGDEVILFGDEQLGHVTPYQLAEWAGTSHYEIVTALGKRVPRIYHSGSTVD